MRISADATAIRNIDKSRATSTTDKQFGDEVTHAEVTGTKPVPWLEWQVKYVNACMWARLHSRCTWVFGCLFLFEIDTQNHVSWSQRNAIGCS